MPANAVTIDNYDIRFHERYASDQTQLDPIFITDANRVHTHSESARSPVTIFSKWTELFEVHLANHPWAMFLPPPQDHMMRNRFFYYALSPQFHWTHDDEQDNEQQEKEEEQHVDGYKKKIFAKKSKSLPMAILEKDRTTLLNLIDQMHLLNGLLRDIHARKLQYQKG